jgi:hypothetical protein
MVEAASRKVPGGMVPNGNEESAWTRFKRWVSGRSAGVGAVEAGVGLHGVRVRVERTPAQPAPTVLIENQTNLYLAARELESKKSETSPSTSAELQTRRAVEALNDLNFLDIYFQNAITAGLANYDEQRRRRGGVEDGRLIPRGLDSLAEKRLHEMALQERVSEGTLIDFALALVEAGIPKGVLDTIGMFSSLKGETTPIEQASVEETLKLVLLKDKLDPNSGAQIYGSHWNHDGTSRPT